MVRCYFGNNEQPERGISARFRSRLLSSAMPAQFFKTTDAGMTWAPLTSGTTNALSNVYFFDATQGVAVGERGLILRTNRWRRRMARRDQRSKGWSSSEPFSGVNGISAGDSQDILYSTDSVSSWQISQRRIFRTPAPWRAYAECDGGICLPDKMPSFDAGVGNTTDGGRVGIFTR